MADDESFDASSTRRDQSGGGSNPGGDDLDFGATLTGFASGQRVFDRYTLNRILGRGGMGLVWLARDEKLERDVALKFLPELVALDERAINDLKRETRRALDLTHSHIVRIYDFVDDDRSAAIAMEWVDGPSLSKLALDKPHEVFAVEEITLWIEQLCSALTYAHEVAQVVHRDLKPANLMIDARSHLKVTDFGISATLSDSTTRVSKAAGTSGTPLYMSPQQMMGERPAVTDDIYALGATVYELLTGKPPFYSGQVQMQVMQKVPPTLAERRAEFGLAGTAIPSAWEETIAACLAKQPSDRPQSVSEVAARLAGAAVGSSSPKVEGATESKSERQRNFNAKAAKPNAKGARKEEGTDRRANGEHRSKTPLVLGLVVALTALASAGWWFGVEQPRRAAWEAERVAAARAAAEAEAEAARVAKERVEAEAEREAAARATAEAVRLAKEQEEAEAEAARIANARGGIVITTEPAGATVVVGEFARETTPATMREVRLGTYPLIVSLDGYEEQRLKVEVKENEFTTHNLELVRSTGSLAITSNPPGLDVTIEPARGVGGGPQTLPTPARLDGLPTGAYALTYRREGWPDQTAQIEVERDTTVSGVAEFIGGELAITSTPDGAEVWSEGRRLGTTPLSLSDLAPAEFDLEFRLADHKPTRQQGSVQVGETTWVRAVLEEILTPQVGKPFENTLGMQFVPVPDTNVLFSIWETRVQDFEAFVVETGHDATGGMFSNRGDRWKEQGDTWRSPGFPQGPNHPVVGVNEADAKAFCAWLTKWERAAGRLAADQSYRLPTDAEWDAAVGDTEYSWGNTWPPSRGAGNYRDEAAKQGRYSAWPHISGYDDGYEASAPVGSFDANAHGIFDLGGNVRERVEGRTNGIRGSSFFDHYRSELTSSNRFPVRSRDAGVGFRVVCVVGAMR